MAREILIKGKKVLYDVLRREGFSRIHFQMELNGKVIITLPQFIPEAKIPKIIHENTQWILDEFAKLEDLKTERDEQNMILIDDREYSYEIQKKKVSRLTLKLNPMGEILLVIPTRFPLSKARDFIESKKDWLAKVLKKYLAQHPAGNLRKLFFQENRIFYHGEKVLVRLIENKSIQKPSFKFLDPADTSLFPDRSYGFEIQCPTLKDKALLLKTAVLGLKELAKKELKELLDCESRKTGIEYNHLRVKEVKTRWGSCSAKKNINLSWRLIMAPLPCQRYVALHELCHIREMNHSPEYWSLVKKVMPDFQEFRQWLKKEGFLLHSF